MDASRYLGVLAHDKSRLEQQEKFISLWAVPRVDPQKETKQKKRRQLNNIVLLFFIYVFKQTQKFISRNKQNTRTR